MSDKPVFYRHSLVDCGSFQLYQLKHAGFILVGQPKPSVPVPPMAYPGVPQKQAAMRSRQEEIARYVINIMFQQMLQEKQHQILQEEIERQIR